MRLIHKGQKGFTLIELVIVIGLTGIITAGITLTIFQVFNMDTRTRNDMIAVYQVRQAGKLVSEDVLEAQCVNVPVSSDFPLTLNWTDPATGNKHGVIYTLANKILWREHYVGSTLNSTTKVAEYISQTSITPAQTECVPNVSALTFTVTATVGEQSETRVYQVNPRTGS